MSARPASLPSPAEILQLRLSPADAEAVLRQLPLKAALAGRARSSEQIIALLDTDGGSLAAAGWVCASRDAEPDLLPLASLGDPPDVAALAPLRILARGSATRAEYTLKLGSRRGTLAVETLALRQGRRQAAVTVLALTGPRREILSFARDVCQPLGAIWDGTAPLATLAMGLGIAAARPWRAADLKLPAANLRSGSALAAFAPLLRAALAHLDANIAAVRHARDVEGVHQMRVALRRVRSLLGLFAPVLPAALCDEIDADLRWLNGPLGRRRDLDVFAVETLAPLMAALPEAEALRHVSMVVEARRAAALKALLSALHSARFAAVRLKLEWLCGLEEAALLPLLSPEQQDAALMPAAAFAAQVLHRYRRRLKKLGRRSDTLSVPDLHRLRIRAKKLRYAVDFFRPMFSRRGVREQAQALAALQECLGALNDAAVGSSLVQDVLGGDGADVAAAAIAGWFAARQQQQLAALPAAWQAYAGQKPFWRGDLPDDPAARPPAAS